MDRWLDERMDGCIQALRDRSLHSHTYVLERLPVDHKTRNAHTKTVTFIIIYGPIQSLQFRKSERPEEPHANTGTTRKLHTPSTRAGIDSKHDKLDIFFQNP